MLLTSQRRFKMVNVYYSINLFLNIGMFHKILSIAVSSVVILCHKIEETRMISQQVDHTKAAAIRCAFVTDQSLTVTIMIPIFFYVSYTTFVVYAARSLFIIFSEKINYIKELQKLVITFELHVRKYFIIPISAAKQ